MKKIRLWLYVLTGVVIIIAGVIFSGCMNFENIHIEGYISILATLIGILVTFAIGYQILNTIEIKNQQKVLRIQQQKADNKLDEVKGYVEEVKGYSTEIKDEQKKVSELLKKQTLLTNSKDMRTTLLLQLDCIKLYIDLKWDEANYGMETLIKFICNLEYADFHTPRLTEEGAVVAQTYNQVKNSIYENVDPFKEEYKPRIKAIETVAANFSLTVQIKQIYLLEKCMEIISEEFVKKLPNCAMNEDIPIRQKVEELLNEYNKLAK